MLTPKRIIPPVNVETVPEPDVFDVLPIYLNNFLSQFTWAPHFTRLRTSEKQEKLDSLSWSQLSYCFYLSLKIQNMRKRTKTSTRQNPVSNLKISKFKTSTNSQGCAHHFLSCTSQKQEKLDSVSRSELSYCFDLSLKIQNIRKKTPKSARHNQVNNPNISKFKTSSNSQGCAHHLLSCTSQKQEELDSVSRSELSYCFDLSLKIQKMRKRTKKSTRHNQVNNPNISKFKTSSNSQGCAHHFLSCT